MHTCFRGCVYRRGMATQAPKKQKLTGSMLRERNMKIVNFLRFARIITLISMHDSVVSMCYLDRLRHWKRRLVKYSDRRRHKNVLLKILGYDR